MARRKRSDSTEAALSAMSAAAETIEPPSYLHVDDGARPFWDDIIKTRHIDTWTPNDLIMAANLSRIHRDIEVYSSIANNTRLSKIDGRVKISPVHRVLKDLTEQAASLSRSLQVHARATQGESRDQVKRNSVFHAARRIQEDIYEDDLISKPIH